MYFGLMLVGAYLASFHLYGMTTIVYTQRLESHIQFKLGWLETSSNIILYYIITFNILNKL